MADRIDLLTPPGRLVAGSLYKPNLTDADGKPLVVKSGPNAGQPRQDFYFGLAIPKGTEQHWSQTEWGAKIYNAGRTGHPAAHQSPTYAWKIKDGDSTIPNRKGKRPVDQEGYPGNWVLSFSSGYAPKTVRDNGTVPILEADAIQLGDWVQVFGSTGDNGASQTPGVYLNHSMVNLIGYGKRIVVGPDAASVGFGAAMPAGASMTPLAGGFVPPAAVGAPVGFPGVLPPVAVPAAFTPPVAVQPHPGFLAPPALPPSVPAVPVARVMTAKAGGASYESFVAQGWTDPMLIQHGYLPA